MINIIFYHTLILLVFFKTDAFIVYSKLFKVNKFFKINEFELYKKTKDCSITYHLYLRSFYPNSFWVKLFTCPICSAVWLCIPTAILFGIPTSTIICVSSIFLYFLIVKLM